ncbi:MAG: site-specific DNA-methyltransferase [Planctomycetota bacterium]|nr:site-specific DNA-methyltransferase [Planctomycetota bacterium]MDA1262577.1 site-specific DNA-methyltransferase [Planctomycetota bacterium]
MQRKEKIESAVPASWSLRRGDCLDVLPTLESASVDLIYLDPPFNSGLRRQGRKGLTFDDRFVDVAAYREFIGPRLIQAHRVLRSTGSILVHVDWRTSHHVRFLLDEIFGAENFVNHLVWAYGLGGSGPRSFARKHDDIFLYGRGPAYWFEPPLVPAKSVRLRGRMKKATDVIDIPSINNMAIERTGWPTQKPIALLNMLVNACCPPNGTVLDITCGSGTTLVAAIQSGRCAMGIDMSDAALAIAQKRLESACLSAVVKHPTQRSARVRRSQTPETSPLAQSA